MTKTKISDDPPNPKRRVECNNCAHVCHPDDLDGLLGLAWSCPECGYDKPDIVFDLMKEDKDYDRSR